MGHTCSMLLLVVCLSALSLANSSPQYGADIVPYVHDTTGEYAPAALPYVHDSRGDVAVSGAYSNVAAGVNSGLCVNVQGAQVACAHANKPVYNSAPNVYSSAAAVPYVHQEIPAVPYVHDSQGDVDMAGAYSNVPTYTTVAGASPVAVPYVHQEIPAMPYVHDSQGDVDMAGAYSNVAGVKSGLCANFQGAQVPCAHANKYNGVSAASAYASAAAVPYVHQEIPAVPYVHDPQGDVDMAGAYSSVPTYNTVASMSPAAVPYVHQEIPAMPYVHDSQGDVDMAGAYSKVGGVNSGLCANSQGAQV